MHILRGGIRMPRIGLGTYQLHSVEAVKSALELGYRLVDTASFYGNEAQVGAAVRSAGIPREGIFVTTKLWPSDFNQAAKAVEESLQTLGVGAVDMFLIHWPGEKKELRERAYSTLLEYQEAGRIRAVGVSNFSIEQLEEIMEGAVVPAVNQVHYSPYYHDDDLVKFCERNKIVVQAYTPLEKGKLKALKSIARDVGVTEAQLALAWIISKNVCPLPKSSNRERQRENLEAEEIVLGQQVIDEIDSMNWNR